MTPSSTRPADQPADTPVYRTPDSVTETVIGLSWLSVGAIVSALMEIFFLGAWVSLPFGWVIPMPITIIIAGWLNYHISATALLWTPRRGVAALPLLAWLLTYLACALWPTVLPVNPDMLLDQTLRSLFLLIVGLFVGLLPLLRPRVQQ